MSVAQESRRCPYCKEAIAVGAIRCKHCHADLPKPKKRLSRISARIDTFRAGFLSGIAFAAIVTILILFHFYSD